MRKGSGWKPEPFFCPDVNGKPTGVYVVTQSD